MATPLRSVHLDRVPSTQDEARRRFDGSPLLVTATGQDHGRGREGASWTDADRSLAASVAFAPAWSPETWSLIPLVAGLAALDVLPGGVMLKWPNDVVVGMDKVGGILAETSDGVTVVGFGLNLWWADPPPGAAGLFDADPGAGHGAPLAEDWAVSLLGRLGSGPEDWGHSEYLQRCSTIGRSIVWAPSGRGRAIDVGRDGALVVEVDGSVVELSSGAVREIRPG